MMFPRITKLCDQLITTFEQIPAERMVVLNELVRFIQEQKDAELPIQLVYVCTHNSRRSHLGQIWANVASHYYRVYPVETFSAGTEATAMHPNTIEALLAQGFEITTTDQTSNPHYRVKFGDSEFSLCYSKTIEDVHLPKSNFAALMTCSDADENCPFIPGCTLRIPTRYEDPKRSDGTPHQLQTYQERSLQIARECLYVFSLIH